jgi:hypothetical protein
VEQRPSRYELPIHRGRDPHLGMHNRENDDVIGPPVPSPAT